MPAKVVLVKCPAYAPADVQAAIRRILKELGGLTRFVRAGQKVLIKPNLLTDRPPAEAVTTHPEIVRALIREVRAQGAQPLVADSASSAINMESVWDATGFRALCREEDVPLLNLEKSGSYPFEIHGFQFSIAKPVLEADVVINVPKLKTHMFTLFTNAVKNLYGVIPGYQKTRLHKKYFEPHRFGALLATIYAQVKPALSVSDAIIAMDGNGPSAGNRIAPGFLAGSADGVALDTALCQLVKIPPAAVPYLVALRQMGIGETHWSNIDLAGDALDQLNIRPMRLPSIQLGQWIPPWLVRWLTPYIWIRPVITDRCVQCGICVESCPASALHMEASQRPVLIPERCIECCCCHEICPSRAIEMRQSRLRFLLARGRLPS